MAGNSRSIVKVAWKNSRSCESLNERSSCRKLQGILVFFSCGLPMRENGRALLSILADCVVWPAEFRPELALIRSYLFYVVRVTMRQVHHNYQNYALFLSLSCFFTKRMKVVFASERRRGWVGAPLYRGPVLARDRFDEGKSVGRGDRKSISTLRNRGNSGCNTYRLTAYVLVFLSLSLSLYLSIYLLPVCVSLFLSGWGRAFKGRAQQKSASSS